MPNAVCKLRANSILYFPKSNNMKKRLGFLDRFLTLWIFLAMLVGVSIGYFIPNSADFINSFSSGTTNVPLAIGLILMMYPPLTKIDFSKVPQMFEKPKLLSASFFITWIVGPLFNVFIGDVLFKRRTRIHDRIDHHRSSALHCYGHRLERTRRRQSGINCWFNRNK